jgi:hypothetical protein
MEGKGANTVYHSIFDLFYAIFHAYSVLEDINSRERSEGLWRNLGIYSGRTVHKNLVQN